MEKRLIVKRVNITSLMEILNKLYHLGVDYVDIHGKKDEKEEDDVIHVSFSPDYIDSEYMHNFEQTFENEFKEEKTPNITVEPLTDDDIQSLI